LQVISVEVYAVLIGEQFVETLRLFNYRKYTAGKRRIVCVEKSRVAVLDESPHPRGSSRTDLQVLVLVLEKSVLDNNTGKE